MVRDGFNGTDDAVAGEEWFEYYARFSYFSSQEIRSGCHPWKMIHPQSEKAIVLIHGLSDSPYFMGALARFFHEELSYTVFLPLLQGHGLKNPSGMEGVSVAEWKRNVAFSVSQASRYGRVSLGGLSTGAALAFLAMEDFSERMGGLYLFSAAFALAGSIIGKVKEYSVRTPLVTLLKWLDRNKSLLGDHPYRYDYVDMGAARELAMLMTEVRRVMKHYSPIRPYPHPVFAIHHQRDRVVSFDAVKKFFASTRENVSLLVTLPPEVEVTHAGVVLEKDIRLQGESGRLLERSNPYFNDLLEKLGQMEITFDKRS